MLEVRRTYHEELTILEQNLLQMGHLSCLMVRDAVEALQNRDVSLASDVIQRDDKVDALDREIEAQCMRLLALQQPMARDLRQIGSALKVTTDLERVGDHAVDIAKIARKLSQRIFVSKPLIDIGPLAEMSLQMLQQSIEALIRRDVPLAYRICADDDQVDDEFKRLREELLSVSQNDVSLVAASSYLLLAVVYLERIADHATNIAERVNYVETGKLEQLSQAHRREAIGAA